MPTPLRVLILEDNPSDAELMRHALREAGFDPIGDRVETEKDYREHLREVPEIVLSDFSMPQFDAVRAIEIMHECHLDIPVIIVSGSIGEEEAVRIMQRGANDYIIKDRLARLGHAVKQALEQKRLREVNRQAEETLYEREERSRKVEEAKQRKEEANRTAQEIAVAVNEALLIGSLRQHELTEAAEKLNTQLRVEMAERKLVEEALRVSDHRYRTLFELGPVAVYSCDAAGVIQEFNRRAAELWGREPKVGDTDHRFCGSIKLIHPEGAIVPHAKSPIADVLSGVLPEVCDGEILIERPDGTRITVMVNIRPLKNALGEVMGVINCFYDISERKLFEAEREAHLVNEKVLRLEAEEANRSKDMFLATLSHEVRTPLNAIMGWASILRGGNCTLADMKEGMEVIERNCKAQAQLIEDVLDVSRIVSGKLRLEMRLCELTDVIAAGIDVVRPAAEARGIKLEVDLDKSASRVTCDPARIQQVLWNLVSNAVKFTPGNGRVRITLARELCGLRIEVSDNGQGISPELLPYVFDRFRQADSSTQRKYGGLGLGLSIVKHIVEMHGGTIHAESPGTGLGSTFRVTMPVRAVQVAESDPETRVKLPDTPAAELTPVRLDGLRVLVVDDEADARRLLSRVLGEAGGVVTAVGSVAEAMRMVETAMPQVLLSDIAMPGEDGYELIRQVRAAGHLAKELPAVALTAYAHKDDRLRALKAGFQMHVPKPIDPHELTAVIATLAGRTGHEELVRL